MFAKSRLQAFTYYNEFDRADRWRDDFAGLKAGGFQYVVLSGGFDLRNQLTSEDQTNRLKEMIAAAEDAGIRSILHIGNPKALYLLPDTRAWRLDYVRRVSEVFGSCKGLYALQLEDAPTGGSEYPEDRWQPVMESVEGRLSTMELTEDGYRHGRRIWQMEQYASFTAEVVKAVKKVRSNLKTTTAFHLDALLPADTLVHFQHAARALDFVIIDPGSPPIQSVPDSDRLIRWAARVAGSLTDREVWRSQALRECAAGTTPRFGNCGNGRARLARQAFPPLAGIPGTIPRGGMAAPYEAGPCRNRTRSSGRLLPPCADR